MSDIRHEARTRSRDELAATRLERGAGLRNAESESVTLESYLLARLIVSIERLEEKLGERRDR